MKADALAIVEAGYRACADEQTWADQVTNALAPFDVGAGVGVGVIDLRAAAPQRVISAKQRGPAPFADHLGARCVELLPRDLLQALYAPSDGLAYVPDAWRMHAGRAGHAMAAILRALPLPLPRAWFGIAGDARREVVLAGVFCPTERDDVPLSHRRLLSSVSAHLGAARRLRLALKGRGSDWTWGADAVATPDGRIVHAEGDGRGAEARETIATAARRVERARGGLRASNPDEALALWQALFDGRWSIVEHEERDGKRYLVARKNEPGGPDVAGIGPAERAVVAYAALGHSYKTMAYELGLSETTIHTQLCGAMRKLGVSSRAELIRVYAPVAAGIARPPRRPHAHPR